MIIRLNTDMSIHGTEALEEQLSAIVRGALAHLSQHITRVEIHLSDVNSDAKNGPSDMHCLLEARPAGHQPVVVSHQARTVPEAVTGAADKLKRSLESLLGRLAER